MDGQLRFHNRGLNNVRIETAHSLAYNNIVYDGKYKEAAKSLKWQIDKIVEVEDLDYLSTLAKALWFDAQKIPVGKEIKYKLKDEEIISAFLLYTITETIDTKVFCTPANLINK